MTDHYTMMRKVQFAETDLAGVVHFSNYFRYMEEVECSFWRSLGFSVNIPTGDGHIGWPRVSVSCEYARPARFEDDLELAIMLTEVNDKSVSFKCEFRIDGICIAVARSSTVCCMTKDGKFQSISIPNEIREKLQAVISRAL